SSQDAGTDHGGNHMKKISVEQLPSEFQKLLEDIERRRILLLRNGQPFAVVSSVGNKDEEDLDLEESSEFWQMIRDRRHEESTVSLEQVKAEIAAEEQRLQGSGEHQLKQPVPDA